MSNPCKTLALALVLGAACTPLAAQTYTLQAFSVPYAPKHNVSAYGINNRGAVVGVFYIPGNHPVSGFKRNANGVFEPPIQDPNSQSTLNNPYTVATGINDSGVVAGYYLNPALHSTTGFLRDNGVFTDFYVQPATDTYILGINNKGDLVGYTSINSTQHGFASMNGIVSPIDFPGGSVTIPYGIAADGTIVGDFVAKNRVTYGFIRGPAGQYKAFQVPGAGDTIPYAINNAVRKIVGSYIPPGQWTGIVHGFIYDYITGVTITVDWPDQSILETAITGINSHGVIVGWVPSYDSNGHRMPAFGFIGTPQ